jgi:hypothetical protein
MRAPVSVDGFRQFVSVLAERVVEVTTVNFGGGFMALSERFSAFRQFPISKKVVTMEDSEGRLRLSALEERLQQRDDEFDFLPSEFARQSQAQKSTARSSRTRLFASENNGHSTRSRGSLNNSPIGECRRTAVPAPDPDLPRQTCLTLNSPQRAMIGFDSKIHPHAACLPAGKGNHETL